MTAYLTRAAIQNNFVEIYDLSVLNPHCVDAAFHMKMLNLQVNAFTDIPDRLSWVAFNARYATRNKSASLSIKAAAQKMLLEHVHHLFVMNCGSLAGGLSVFNFVRLAAEFAGNNVDEDIAEN